MVRKAGKKDGGKDKETKSIFYKIVERERKDKGQLPKKIIIVDPRDKENVDELLLSDENVAKNTGSQQIKTGNNNKRKGTNKKR